MWPLNSCSACVATEQTLWLLNAFAVWAPEQHIHCMLYRAVLWARSWWTRCGAWRWRSRESASYSSSMTLCPRRSARRFRAKSNRRMIATAFCVCSRYAHWMSGLCCFAVARCLRRTPNSVLQEASALGHELRQAFSAFAVNSVAPPGWCLLCGQLRPYVHLIALSSWCDSQYNLSLPVLPTFRTECLTSDCMHSCAPKLLLQRSPPVCCFPCI